jgi:hypothetical protein
MSTTITAPVARELREALYDQLGKVAEDMPVDRRVLTRDQLKEWTRVVSRFDRARGLLDRIGWITEGERDATIDLAAHRRGLIDALGDDLAAWQSVEESESREDARERILLIESFAASVGLDVVSEPVERWITVPSDFAATLLEALIEAIGHAADEIEACGFDTACCRERVAGVASIAAALDAIGWGERAEIDVDTHHGALQAALAERLTTERSMAASTPRDEQHRLAALGYAHAIEAFMRDTGLTIDAGEGR